MTVSLARQQRMTQRTYAQRYAATLTITSSDKHREGGGAIHQQRMQSMKSGSVESLRSVKNFEPLSKKVRQQSSHGSVWYS